ncbi:MAG: kynureninase [Intrasporangium sp.]|uniref:kynureninase n=1 Tax=Intrasporangium sp. TaxID=1925024 RepID=UPI002649F5F3|nr:kynureninase [Intrasporangium sp.]MDN5795413.1 kynureninase [Intrasporangium sp.]
MTTTTPDLITRDACVAADQSDPLASFRDRFRLPDGVIYLDGNSLGPLPKQALERARQVIESEWGRDLITSWNTNGWFDLPVRIGTKISRLIGGQAGACVATDTTSINVFKALGAALAVQAEDQPGRKVVISERDNFPTDLYMTEGMVEFLDHGYELKLVDDDSTLDDLLGDDVAVVLFTHVNYRTGRLWDLVGVTQQIHAAGALAIWDLCHSVGALEVAVSEAGADFAIGCTYKYLNGGPGSPAFIWVADRHLARARQPLSGWWGHAKPFDMAVSYAPADGIRRFLCGTQPITSLAMMEVGVDIALSADMALVREKSLALTSLFIGLVEQRLPDHPLTLITPRSHEERGSHVSLRHPDGFAVMKALIANGVLGDYREPEVLRFGITPLYLGYADVWDAVETLRRVLDENLWMAPEFQLREAVT